MANSSLNLQNGVLGANAMLVHAILVSFLDVRQSFAFLICASLIRSPVGYTTRHA